MQYSLLRSPRFVPNPRLAALDKSVHRSKLRWLPFFSNSPFLHLSAFLSAGRFVTSFLVLCSLPLVRPGRCILGQAGRLTYAPVGQAFLFVLDWVRLFCRFEPAGRNGLARTWCSGYPPAQYLRSKLKVLAQTGSKPPIEIEGFNTKTH